MKKYNVCVLGATGMVGREMIRVLEERNFPVDRFLPLASERTAGQTVAFHGKEYMVEVAQPESFKGIEIGLFSAGAKLSAALAPEAAKRGCVVIDNTSRFRMDPEVPLIVPEVNGHAIKKHKGIIANPNCSTAQMVLVLKPIYDAVGIEWVVVSTYQSVSGWGKEAVEHIWRNLQTEQGLSKSLRCHIAQSPDKFFARKGAKLPGFKFVAFINLTDPLGFQMVKKLMGDHQLQKMFGELCRLNFAQELFMKFS